MSWHENVVLINVSFGEWMERLTIWGLQKDVVCSFYSYKVCLVEMNYLRHTEKSGWVKGCGVTLIRA